MKNPWVALFFVAASSLCAQDLSSGPTSACGPANLTFSVSQDHAPHALAIPDPGKALVYFIQETGVKSMLVVYPTTKIAIDGDWVGAYKKDSFLSAPIEPGQHHLCARLDSLATGHQVQLAHFTAEAGKTYFFRTHLYFAQGLEYFQLEPVDSDEPKFLIASEPLSVSRANR